MRSKSPTIQSPPMSPVSRMPSSPKSPRKKVTSMALMNNIIQQQPQQTNAPSKVSLFSPESVSID